MGSYWRIIGPNMSYMGTGLPDDGGLGTMNCWVGALTCVVL